MTSHDIFVIGTVSLDVLHFAGQTAEAAGGAAMYTALAAWRAGAKVNLSAPRPEPMPKLLQPLADRLTWTGPLIAPSDLSRLEIAHHGGGKATLVSTSWGAGEAILRPAMLPLNIADASIVHIAALSSAARQLEFATYLATHKNSISPQNSTALPLISVGTYSCLAYQQTDQVKQLLTLADLFFMNENEAKGIFGQVDQATARPNSLLFITLGEAGALVLDGYKVTHIHGVATHELDPTGAGDTFCGATLAALAHGESPLVAASQAVSLAAQTVSAVGPTALW